MNKCLAPLAFLALVGCAAQESGSSTDSSGKGSPIAGARPSDHLIQPDEVHFAHLWQVTVGGQNAEGYWNPAGDALIYQRTNDDAKFGEVWPCDRIFTTRPGGGAPVQISSGQGVTTCAYFMPGGSQVVFASTQHWQVDCPPKADHSKGYTWSIHPQYDIWVKDLDTQIERRIIDQWGYDAEATVSPLGDRMVFTSTRSGDIELWTCDLNGGDLKQVTHTLGYDGGAFFSHDGKRLVFRCTKFSAENRAAEEATYRQLRSEWKVRPQAMDLFVIDADGKNRTQVTDLGGASFAPYFFPDDQRIIFSSNHRDPKQRNFDLFAVNVDGSNLETLTSYSGFDSFPMFSPDGRYLVFASNRGGTVAGETNLFIAEWK